MRNEQNRIEQMYLGDYKSFEQMAYEETLGQIIEDNQQSFQRFYSLFTDEEEAFNVIIQDIIILNDRTNPMLIKSKSKNSMSCTLDTAISSLLSLKIKGVSRRQEKYQASCLIIQSLDGVIFNIIEEITQKNDIMIMLENRLSYPPVKDSDIPIYRNSLMAMVSEPREWHQGDTTGGYLKYPFSLILNRGKQDQIDEATKHLNILQSNAWTLSRHAEKANPTAFWREAMIKKGSTEYIAEETAKQKYEFYQKAVGYYADKENIFLAWNMDFRGRSYSKGYMINAQGDKITKGMLVPKNKQKVTIKGAEWLLINIANLFGDDKLLFQERIAKYNLTVEELRAMTEDAESPIEFANAIDALEDYKKTGTCNSLVYLDASNQALQMYAVLTGDKDTARICNLASGDKIEDAYKDLAKLINIEIGFDYLRRSDTKKALMTAMYGKEDITSVIINAKYPSLPIEEATERVAKDLNLEIEQTDKGMRCTDFDTICIESLNKLAPRAMEQMNAILASHDATATQINWSTPIGFNVEFNVKVKVPYAFRFVFSNDYVFEREGITEEYGASQTSRALSPNIIHSLDGWVGAEVVNRMNAKGKYITTIFDAFGVHANDCELVKEIYDDIMVELLNATVLEDIISGTRGYKYTIDKGDVSEFDIRNSRYSIG